MPNTCIMGQGGWNGSQPGIREPVTQIPKTQAKYK